MKNKQHRICGKRLLVYLLVLCQLFSLTACDMQATSHVKLPDYGEYVSSFFQEDEFHPFDLSGELDLSTSVYMADLAINNHKSISEDSKTKLFDAFREQQVSEDYDLKKLHVNETLEMWDTYLHLLSSIDADEYNEIKDEADQILSQMLSNWDKKLKETDFADDPLSRLNVLTCLTHLNEYVKNDSYTKQIQALAQKELALFKEENISSNDELMIPYLYYFIELNVWDTKQPVKWHTIKKNIYDIFSGMKNDQYEFFFFYLKYCYTILEFYEKGSFSKDFADESLEVIRTYVDKGQFDWLSLWEAQKYINNIIPQETTEQLLSKLSVTENMDLTQEQTISLSDSYATIYYYLYLMDSAKRELSDSQKESICEILNEKTKTPDEYTAKEYYYNLKIADLQIADNVSLIPADTVKKILNERLENQSIQVQDAGTLYYLMLLAKEYQVFSLSDVSKLLDKQKELIEKNKEDSSIHDTLSYMLYAMENGIDELPNSFIEDDTFFPNNIYFMAHCGLSLTETEQESFEQILQNHMSEYGFASYEEKQATELETTYRCIYLCRQLLTSQ